MAVQQYRLVKLALILIIVTLTLFLYAIYFTSPSDLDPSANRLHSIAISDALILSHKNNLLVTDIEKDDKNRTLIRDFKAIRLDGTQHKENVIDPGGTDLGNKNLTNDVFENVMDGSSPSKESSNNIEHQLQPSSTHSNVNAQRSIKSANNEKSDTANASVIAPVKQAEQILKKLTTGPVDQNTLKTELVYEPGHFESNAQLCSDNGEYLKLLIIITSAPTHREARSSIRQTWGHYAIRRDVSIAFILGSSESQTIEDSLSAENYMYGDLIRGHFIDSYNNLTLKTISTLEWVDTYCQRVAFILKTDDDMFINVPRLLAFIDLHQKDRRTIYGRLAKKWEPIRNRKSKYYVSPQQYLPSVFPAFTTGPAYLMTVDVVHDLYKKSLNQTYLKLEDVFTTGIVAQLCNIKRVHVAEFVNRRIAFNSCSIRKSISVHKVKSNEQLDLWKKLLDTNTKCK